jgi:hypothetical protein
MEHGFTNRNCLKITMFLSLIKNDIAGSVRINTSLMKKITLLSFRAISHQNFGQFTTIIKLKS